MAELSDVNADLIAGLPDRGPVVMVNLLLLRDRDAYRRYSELAMPLIKARGGTVIWAGNGEAMAFGDPVADRWDYAVLVRYPRARPSSTWSAHPSTPLPMCTASRQ